LHCALQVGHGNIHLLLRQQSAIFANEEIHGLESSFQTDYFPFDDAVDHAANDIVFLELSDTQIASLFT
jgi:hypothetical protein